MKFKMFYEMWSFILLAGPRVPAFTSHIQSFACIYIRQPKCFQHSLDFWLIMFKRLKCLVKVEFELWPKNRVEGLYSWVQKVVYGYEANLLLSPMFEGQYIWSSSMEFHVMGLIWKLVAWSLTCQHFVRLSRTATENWVDKEDALTPILLYVWADRSSK